VEFALITCKNALMPSSSISYHLLACGKKNHRIKETKKARQLIRREVIGPALTLKIAMYTNYYRYPPIMPMRNRQIRTLSPFVDFCPIIACCILLLDLSLSVFYQFLRSASVVPYALYSLPYIIPVIKSIKMRVAGHVARTGNKNGTYGSLIGRLEGRIPLGRPRRRWENNIKMDL
jgi:hypothetical protein